MLDSLLSVLPFLRQRQVLLSNSQRLGKSFFPLVTINFLFFMPGFPIPRLAVQLPTAEDRSIPGFQVWRRTAGGPLPP